MEGLDDDDAKNDVCLLCIVLLNREFSFLKRIFFFNVNYLAMKYMYNIKPYYNLSGLIFQNYP